MSSPGALVLFARTPRLGRVKTRLQPDLSPEESLILHRALVADAVTVLRDFVRRQNVQGIIALSEGLDPLSPDDELWRGVPVVKQQGADLGERLVHAFQDQLQGGARRVVIIGSDSPSLDGTYLEAAFEALEEDDAVIGPAEDGGYILIGCSRLLVRPFQGISWGSERVLQQTRRALKKLQVRHRLLRPLHDLDTVHDLIRTRRELEHLEQVGAPRAPATLEALRTLARAHPDRGLS